jgi:hypothetical protein
MAYELIRTIVQKILQDKILLGLVIVAFLGIFVGGMTMGDEKPSDTKAAAKHEPAPGAAPQQQAAQQPQQQAHGGTQTLTPTLAQDFVTWWLTVAMDYNSATAQQNHNQATAWMTADAARAYSMTLWTPQIAEAVTTGRLIAAFQPTGVQAQAVNPDGSVVVGVSGTMVVQSGGQPVVQQFLGSFLVKQDIDGMRIAGLNTRTGVLPGSSVY